MIGHTYYHLWKGIALTSTSMVGHTYCYLWKGIALASISMIGNTIYHPWKGSSLIFDHARNQSSLHVERDLNPKLRIPGN